MKYYHKYIGWFQNANCICVLFALLFISCEKSLDYQIDNQDSQLVMYAFPMADSILEVHASYSTNILSVDDYSEVEALTVFVQINSDDEVVSNYPSSDEWFKINSVSLNQNDTIRIRYNLNDSITSSAETIVPQVVDIMSVDTLSVWEFNDDNEEELMLRCNLMMTDPEEANYYQIRVDVFTQSSSSGEWEQETIDYEEEDKVFSSGDYEAVLLADIDYQGTFDDYLFNDEEYEVEFLIPNEYIASTSDDDKKILVFYLYSLSEEYYYYVRSVNEQEAYRDDALYEQSNVYSNVSEGLGLVGGLSVSVDSLVVYSNE